MSRASFHLFVLAFVGWMLATGTSFAGPPPGDPVAFADLPGFAADDLRAALATFRASCAGRDRARP